MEVASNSTQILLQRKDPRVYSMAGERRSLLMTPATNSRETEPNQAYPVNGSPLLLDVDVPSSSASDVTDPSPGMLNMTPPPEVDADKKGEQLNGEQNGTSSPKLPEENGVASKKRKYVRKTVENAEGQKLRVTRNRDGDASEAVINNYVDTGEKRQVWPRVVPPNGLKRQPFKPPRGELEKEKDKLKINMVGPKTKTTMNAMKEMQPQRTHSVISEGFEFQANFDHYLAEDFQKPTISVDEIPDRDDQMMWIDDRVKLKDKERELDEAWTAVRRQFGGKVGLDSMLRRLMKCDYDIDKMLLTIEEELLDLPHPFEEFNEAQQAEFEKWLCYETGTGSGTRKKNFRRMQETFLKGYYLGELVQYYYESKHRGCAHRLYHRCACKKNLIVEFPSVQRYECYNCTKYLWSTILPERSTRGQSYCSVCELYFSRRKKHRVVSSPLTEPDEKIAKAWFELEKTREKPVTKKEVFKYMENQRLETINVRDVIDQLPSTKGKAGKITNLELFEKTKKFTPKLDPKCWTMNKWGKISRKLAVQSYTPAEKLVIVKAFGKYGLDFEKVATELGKTALEMESFYGRFAEELLLDRLITPVKKETWLGHHLAAHTETRLSNSPTPEPMGRRKRNIVPVNYGQLCKCQVVIRAASDDPSYEARGSREVPPAKTTRRTRQTQAVEKEDHDDSASNPVPDVGPSLLE